jgi:hypothetical protein
MPSGDAALLPYDDIPGNTIEAKFYSFHTYRHGCWSYVSHKHDFNVRQATPAETVKHGHWCSHGSPSADMPTHYREWSLEGCIYYTVMHVIFSAIISPSLAIWGVEDRVFSVQVLFRGGFEYKVWFCRHLIFWEDHGSETFKFGPGGGLII